MCDRSLGMVSKELFKNLHPIGHLHRSLPVSQQCIEDKAVQSLLAATPEWTSRCPTALLFPPNLANLICTLQQTNHGYFSALNCPTKRLISDNETGHIFAHNV